MEYYPVSQIPQTLVDNLERWNRKFNKEASLGHLKVLSDLQGSANCGAASYI
jgi:hypothetical protein